MSEDEEIEIIEGQVNQLKEMFNTMMSNAQTMTEQIEQRLAKLAEKKRNLK